ncbi:hypothetical protein F383_07018 [Gossypium arboreum]|uniref:Uncharacterized protein n=1 Tax=Gossypium arboreum TaxID=29729 RepID=A0A0B0NXA1_GOSAR|nr:hypothetical protein F383_07018 [Gossypium arboreum]
MSQLHGPITNTLTQYPNQSPNGPNTKPNFGKP